MKKHNLLFVLLFVAAVAQAQTSAKKYVLIEHFTNSNCSSCASKNPAFYNLIDDYPNDIHHVSVHPPIPYAACVFYQANKTENSAWSNLHGIDGTPRVALNGTLIPSSPSLLPAATLQTYLNQTSPLWLEVTEDGPPSERVATIEAHSLGEIPSGTYNIFAAVVEKTRNQNTPNGESVHHDVFRKMLTPVAGTAFTPATQGQSVTVSYDYIISPNWVAAEIYVVAWVQNATTKEVLNSGTRFDPIVTGTDEAAPQTIQIQPNPVSDIAVARIGDDTAKQLEVYDVSGQRVTLTFENQEVGTLNIPTATLAAGIYFVKITGEKGVYVAKMVKGN